MEHYSAEISLPADVWSRLVTVRREEPGRSLSLAKSRRRRDRLSTDGKLNILAADHPARRVTKVGEDPFGMANRRDYIARIARVLTGHSVDCGR